MGLPERRTDPVQSFNRWKKKYTNKKEKFKQQRKQKKKPDWQVERENISRLVQKYSAININEVIKFSDFPLSKKTLKGLLEAQYRMPTEIQKQTIGSALQGKDVLGAAKTGSGKTLAFLIPALECLYRQQWTADDGLGVLIISPTRELAYQTFEVLRKVGKNHEFSAGLIIGGKDLKQESERINRTNILVCTPGRLLQHMDETSYFHASSLHMLILDEADRILDMGFAETMNAIVENLPQKRQTLLFSATQTKSVKDLARLSLKDPEYVWVHEKAKFSTPATLEQKFVVCDLQQKVNLLYSFLRSHLKKKSIVFFASCKEVQYLFRVFCRLRPGIPVLALHGKQQQMKRIEVYNDFVRKKAAVLFATDIAARGLDFPAVNWVLQLDCPEDASTYIHRVGRTARYKEGGEALLVLLPSEQKGMVQQLLERKIPIEEIKINPDKILDVQTRLEAFLAQEQELKERAQRCFVSYLRSVYLMKNKDVFDVFKLSLTEYALSLGLAVPPRIRFLQKAQNQHLFTDGGREGAAAPGSVGQRGDACASVSDEELEAYRAHFSQKQPDALQRGGERTEKETKSLGKTEEDELEGESEGQTLHEKREIRKEAAVPVQFLDEDAEDDDTRDLDFLTVKRRDVFGLEAEAESSLNAAKESPVSKPKKFEKSTRAMGAKKVLKKKFKVNTKISFTDDGELIQQWPSVQKSAVKEIQDDEDSNGINLDKARERLHEEDKFDKEEYRKKIKEKHREKRLKEKAARRAFGKKKEEAKDEPVVYLGRGGSEDEDSSSTLPDPNEDFDQEDDRALEENNSELEEKTMERKRTYSCIKRDKAREKTSGSKRKKTKHNHEESFTPLDTGLSLAEDEELVLHLLSN
ncbi:probable ATP-dependent RNA helicase DDX10 isoform X2 [Rhinatrema bivittatum]|uniref:probable ATP-dependent RNA helicase DDX10 isoform X2 n=1 Tax=Rhinatrema bivittatum TaxID=194408 RepID=UPI00112A9B51|nr:probable ATP-dependent RNA helicase DDX10 isoform X2 [Rhinatrema bivittatum]